MEIELSGSGCYICCWKHQIEQINMDVMSSVDIEKPNCIQLNVE